MAEPGTRGILTSVTTLPSRLALATIGFYRKSISPLFPPSCRYVPTCSEYMQTAVERYGMLKGVSMGLRRILRCHPFHPGGYDPVP